MATYIYKCEYYLLAEFDIFLYYQVDGGIQ